VDFNLKTLPIDLLQVYTIHLLDAAGNAKAYQKNFSNYTWLSKNPSTAANAIRAALPSWFNEMYLNETIFIDPPQLSQL